MWCCRRGETSLDVLQLIAPAQQHAADYVKRYTAGEEMWRTADRTAITLHTGLRCPRGMLYNEKLASPTCYAAGSSRSAMPSVFYSFSAYISPPVSTPCSPPSTPLPNFHLPPHTSRSQAGAQCVPGLPRHGACRNVQGEQRGGGRLRLVCGCEAGGVRCGGCVKLGDALQRPLPLGSSLSGKLPPPYPSPPHTLPHTLSCRPGIAGHPCPWRRPSSTPSLCSAR